MFLHDVEFLRLRAIIREKTQRHIQHQQFITVYVLDRNSLSLNNHNSFIFFNIRINKDRKSGLLIYMHKFILVKQAQHQYVKYKKCQQLYCYFFRR